MYIFISATPALAQESHITDTGKKFMNNYPVHLILMKTGVKDVDLILTFRNIHNLSASARKIVNDATFKTFKPRGIYSVINHTKRYSNHLVSNSY